MSVKKRGISAIVTLLLIFSLSAVTATDTKAAEETKAKSAEEFPMIDGSYLIKDEESVGGNDTVNSRRRPDDGIFKNSETWRRRNLCRRNDDCVSHGG